VFLPAFAVLLYFSAPVVLDLAHAEDTVVVSAGRGGGQLRLTGRILEYNDQELRIELSGERVRTFPATDVLSVATEYGPHYHAALTACEEGRHDAALLAFRQALQSEPRQWVRQQIVAHMIRCHLWLGQWGQAGEQFLLLLSQYPHTRHFDCIPLAWLPRQPAPTLEQAARQWLKQPQPAAQLLGASHLLVTADAQAAMDRLVQLASHPEQRIAQLATAQTWRMALARADEEQIAKWERTVAAMPEGLRAGPYYLLGAAWMRRQQWESASLAFLRVAILYPHQRALAAQALLDAGRCLEQLDQKPAARRLYEEILRDHAAESRVASEARVRLAEEGR
jgi:tetratricopeptide (TPR) repeat protein